MTIDNLAQLKKLIRLCRDEGVNHIVIDGIDMQLEGTPKEAKAVTQARQFDAMASTFDPGTISTPDMPTEEQIMFGSSDPSVWQKGEQ